VDSPSRRQRRRIGLAFWAALPLAVTSVGAWAFHQWWLLVLGLALMATVAAVGREADRMQNHG
jgi:hypothetical protein